MKVGWIVCSLGMVKAPGWVLFLMDNRRLSIVFDGDSIFCYRLFF